MSKYPVEFTLTIEVDAENGIEAVELAKAQLSVDDMYIYVDGNLWN